jgi:hypothetical protein
MSRIMGFESRATPVVASLLLGVIERADGYAGLLQR